ncbi:MAG: hypothetical protein ACO3ZY_09255 [Phycisphaerales bacterium]
MRTQERDGLGIAARLDDPDALVGDRHLELDEIVAIEEFLEDFVPHPHSSARLHADLHLLGVVDDQRRDRGIVALGRRLDDAEIALLAMHHGAADLVVLPQQLHPDRAILRDEPDVAQGVLRIGLGRDLASGDGRRRIARSLRSAGLRGARGERGRETRDAEGDEGGPDHQPNSP